MKRKSSPKKYLLSISLFVITFLVSCKRDALIEKSQQKEISILQAKQFYDENVKNDFRTQNISSSNFSAKSKDRLIKKLGKYLRWNSTQTLTTDNESILLVDIDDSNISLKRDITIIRKLIFSKINTPNIEMNVVEVISFKKNNEKTILERIKTAFQDHKKGRPQKHTNDITVLVYDANYIRSSTFTKGESVPSIIRSKIDPKNTIQNTTSSTTFQSKSSVDCVQWGVFHILRDGTGNIISETLLYTYYIGDCGGVITTEDNSEGAPIGGELENLEQMYQQMLDDYAEIIEDQTISTTGTSTADQPDPIEDIVSWEVGKGRFASWSVIADTKYSYYHTEYFDIPQMRMVQNYDVTLYKTTNIVFSGSNHVITSTWSTTNIIDQVLNNNTENAKGRSKVTGTVNHSSNIKITIRGVQLDKILSSVTHVNSKPFELIFR